MKPSQDTHPTNQLDVLVADDSLLHQRVAVHLLEQRGHHVTVANNGAEALSALRGRRFDLCLMDVDMPETDGLSATREIREREQAEKSVRMPIIGVTANENPEECLEAGMDAFLPKPLGSLPLTQTLREVLG